MFTCEHLKSAARASPRHSLPVGHVAPTRLAQHPDEKEQTCTGLTRAPRIQSIASVSARLCPEREERFCLSPAVVQPIWKSKRMEIFRSGESGQFKVLDPILSHDPKLFLSALWIYFFFGSVYFLINIAGYTFKDYSTVVLQLTGIINATGTLILAFYLDPLLARIFERERDRADLALKSVLLAQVVNYGIVSPVVFYSLSLFLL